MKDRADQAMLVSTPDLRPSLLSILRGLHEGGQLARVVTTVALSGRQVERLSRLPGIGARLGGLVARRRLPDFLEGKTDCLWERELVRAIVSRAGFPRLTHRVWHWAETAFDAEVAKRYAGRYPGVYGMEHSSAATFAAQKASGGWCVLRQVTAHARTIAAVLEREAVRFPAHASAYHRLLLDESEAVILRKEREYALADLIVANSDYVRQTFVDQGVDPGKVVAVPTGCPPTDAVGARSGAGEGALRFLYVGNLSLRKGIADLAAAWEAIASRPGAELWMAGPAEVPIAAFPGFSRGVRYHGRLAKEALAQLYRQADVLVLPTLCEGLAHAVLEALSFGLPVITTAASGCGKLVVADENGWLVPAGDAGALREAMAEAMQDRGRLQAFGRVSREKAGDWTVARSNEMHLRYLREFMEKGTVN